MNPVTDFNTLSLPEAVKTALKNQSIQTPTPIQAQAIPHALAGKDVVGLAQTGTGKTLAFCLPLITALSSDENQNSTALILAPTREIAIQVTEVIKGLTADMKGRWSPLLVIGGVGMQPQIDGLAKKPRLIIATPGRLVDHLREGNAKLDTVNFLVLDEADRMLDMGFAPQLNEILRGLPRERQTMLFSATFPREIEDMSQKYLRSPERVEVGAGHSKVVDTVTQVVKEMSDEDKMPALLEALKEREGTIIVFVRTKHRTERIAKQLEKNGHSAGRIHGDRSQGQRQSTLSAFREGKIRVLVATDIAARGIDVPNVAHVINFDIPNVPEEYIHRIGRTGRAGSTGESLSFVTPEVAEEWYAILKLIDPAKARSMPKPTNVPRPEKPQQHGGHRHQQQRHQQRPQREQETRPQRQQSQGQSAPQSSGAGQTATRFGQRPYSTPRNDRDSRPSQEQHHATSSLWDEEDDSFNRQPSLEEQLTRIDADKGRRQRPQGHGGHHKQAHGGGHKGRQAQRWEVPKKHPYARNQTQKTTTSNTKAVTHDENDGSDDNIGNR